MVHMNIFCEMGLEISDPKDELWTKTEILRRFQNSKFGFEVQNRLPTRPPPVPGREWVRPGRPFPDPAARPSGGPPGGGWGACKYHQGP